MRKASLRTISPKKETPVREKTYEYLKSAILSDRIHPGERLTEERLAEEMGVSRTPVREALHKLESEGLINPLKTRGFVVSKDSREEVEELFDMRAILEGFGLRVISEKVSEELVEKLNGVIEKGEDALTRKQMREVFKWNTQFHDMLHRVVAEKKRLHRLLVNMRKYVLRYRENTLQYPVGGRRALDGHRKIVMALGLKDPDLCERVMREHIQEAKEDALQFLFGRY